MVCDLPYVNPNICYSLYKEVVVGNNDELYSKEKLQKIAEKNPTISCFIEKFAALSDDPLSIMFCGILVYRLLESQAEANKMLKEIALE